MSAANVLRVVVDALDAAGIPSMLSGSFAAGFHGLQRSTLDIDIVIDPSRDALDTFLSALDPETLYFDREVARSALRARSQFNVIDMASNWKIDLIIRKNRPFSLEEMKRRFRGTVLGVEVSLVTAEDAILSKLEWAKAGDSDRQLRDVRELVRLHEGRLEKAYLQRWIDELELEDIWQRI